MISTTLHSRTAKAMAMASTALVVGVAVTVNVAATGTAHAAGASISNGGSRAFSICHNAASESACSSGVGSLSSGQNSASKYGWDDTDMIQIPANCDLHHYYYRSGQTSWGLWATAGASSRWFKVSDVYGGSYKVVC